MRPRVLATRKLPALVEARLAERFDFRANPDDAALDRAGLAEALAWADGLAPTVSDRIDAALLEGARAKIIANVGVGFSNIGVAAAKAKGIAVTNTPDVLTEATADVALYLILAATRGMTAAEARLRAGEWSGFSLVDHLGVSPQGKTLAVIGMGRIGRATARRAALGLGMRVVYWNRSPVADLDFPAEAAQSLEAALAAGDVVSLHIPGGAGRPPIGREELAAIKPGAFLVNTARGDVVDEAALIEALEGGRLAGAGLDVFAEEPKVPARLRALPNVTLLPHVGSATQEVRTAMGMLAADNLIAFFEGREPPNRVA